MRFVFAFLSVGAVVMAAGLSWVYDGTLATAAMTGITQLLALIVATMAFSVALDRSA